MARYISYNTLQLHQTAQILVIVYGYLNQLSIDTNILGFCLEYGVARAYFKLMVPGRNNNHQFVVGTL